MSVVRMCRGNVGLYANLSNECDKNVPKECEAIANEYFVYAFSVLKEYFVQKEFFV